MKKVGLITVHYNTPKDVIDCITSLQILSLRNISLYVYVVDNHSQEETVKTIEMFLNKNVTQKYVQRFIKSEINTGFSGGNNIGIQQAFDDGCEYIILLNSDTIVDVYLIEELVSASDQHQEVAIIAPKIYFAPGYEFYKDRYANKEKGKVIWYAGGKIDWSNVIGSHIGVDEVDNGQFETPGLTEVATGCCMLITKKTIQHVGLLDEAYFMYYEDAAYSMLLKKKRLGILYWPKAVLWHKNATSSGGSGSALQEYYITRNRLLFGIRFAPVRAKIALLRESFRLLLRGTRWQRRGVIDYYCHRLGKGSYGAL